MGGGMASEARSERVPPPGLGQSSPSRAAATTLTHV